MAANWEKIQDILAHLGREKQSISSTYLTETSLTDLKDKLRHADEEASRIISVWESSDPADLVDDATVGWETKKQEAIDVRDQIHRLLQPKIDELEIREAKSELAGAGNVATTKDIATATENLKLVELQGIAGNLREQYRNLTTFLKTATEELISVKLQQLSVLHGSYVAKYHGIDERILSEAESKNLQAQRKGIHRETTMDK